jgi:hypothetical protein
VSVRLRCAGCRQEWLSALFYRGPGGHVCKHCGGQLSLANAGDERRTGSERRSEPAAPVVNEWRSGHDRREPGQSSAA